MPVLPTSVYPLRGMFYLLSHPSLCRRLLCGLIAIVLFSIVASILLFLFVFPWQAQALSDYTSVWLAWLISFLLTVLEIGTSVLIFSSVFVAHYMSHIFDAVCREETMLFNREETSTTMTSRYSCLKSLLILLIFRVFLLVVTSPLNLIPLLGTLLYIYVNAFYYAWSLHCRYFDLLGLTFAQGLLVRQNRRRRDIFSHSRTTFCRIEPVCVHSIRCRCRSSRTDSIGEYHQSNKQCHWKCSVGL